MTPRENVQIEARRPAAATADQGHTASRAEGREAPGSTELPAPHVTVDVAVLEMLLKAAASAALHVGHISDGPQKPVVVDPLADALDEIVHTLTELLGSPHVI